MRTLLVLLALLTPALASGEAYSITPDTSKVEFTARLLGQNVPCSFKSFEGKVTVDPAHPDQLKAEAKIEIASISTGIDKRDRHLRSPDYFDAEKYPSMLFQSLSSKPAANGDFDLLGNLTIKQTTKAVTLHVHPLKNAGSPAWNAQAEVNRKDFGISRAALADKGIGDTIMISLHVEGQPAAR